MAECSKCHQQVTDTIKYCPNCGAPVVEQLSKEISGQAWIAATQEKIRDTNRATSNYRLSTFGSILLAVVCLIYDPVRWLSVVFFFAFIGFGFAYLRSRKKKLQLVNQLEKGQR